MLKKHRVWRENIQSYYKFTFKAEWLYCILNFLSVSCRLHALMKAVGKGWDGFEGRQSLKIGLDVILRRIVQFVYAT